MAPPISSVSHTSSRALITPSLSDTFDPPRMATNGRGGSLRRPSRTSTSSRQQPAGGRGQRAGRPDDRGVGPVRGAEGVVHVAVEPVDEAGDEGGVVRLLAGVEAQVLGQLDAGAAARRGGPARRPSSSGGRARPSAAPGGSRPRSGRALRLQPLERGQGGADAQVVGDLAALHRHVEVDPDEHRAALDGRQVLEDGDAEDRHRRAPAYFDWLARPTISTRSTRRFE